MLRMIAQMRDRMKARVGIYGTGWNPESIMGLVFPFLLVALLAFIGWLMISSLS